MISKPLIWSMVIVGLPDVNIDVFIPISKLDYTMPYDGCQQEKNKSVMEYNYTTTEELIKSNIKKYQEILSEGETVD
jgi:hypothetical protein